MPKVLSAQKLQTYKRALADVDILPDGSAHSTPRSVGDALDPRRFDAADLRELITSYEALVAEVRALGHRLQCAPLPPPSNRNRAEAQLVQVGRAVGRQLQDLLDKDFGPVSIL